MKINLGKKSFKFKTHGRLRHKPGSHFSAVVRGKLNSSADHPDGTSEHHATIHTMHAKGEMDMTNDVGEEPQDSAEAMDNMMRNKRKQKVEEELD